MTRKHVRRKHYAPCNPIALAILGAAITDTEHLDRLRMIELQALESFRTGRATKMDWDHLADLVNLCETLCLRGVGPEAMEPCERGQEALAQAHRRYLEHGRIAFSGPELQAMREVFAFHDLQRSSVARSVYESAIVDCANRIRSAHPSLKVMMPAKEGA